MWSNLDHIPFFYFLSSPVPSRLGVQYRYAAGRSRIREMGPGEQFEAGNESSSVPVDLRSLPLVFSTVDDLIEAHGERFEGQTPGQRTGLKGECFQNALALARDRPTLRYYEGKADPGDGSGEHTHAWCADADGAVIDPTWDAPPASYHGVHIPIEEIGWDAVEEMRRFSPGGRVLTTFGYGNPLLRFQWPLSPQSIARLRAGLDGIQPQP